MEIIKHGNQHIEKTCSNCGCIFSFNKTEIQEETRFYYNYDKCASELKVKTYIKCPECNEILEAEKQNLNKGE